VPLLLCSLFLSIYFKGFFLMTISVPPQVPPTSGPVSPRPSPGPGASGLGGTTTLTIENNEADNSSQINTAQVQNSNVQINTAYQRPDGEALGGGIVLNNPLSVYGQVTTNGSYTQGSVGVQWTPGRGRTARRILKQRQQQIEQDIQLTQFNAQLAKEKHCAELLRAGFTTQSCDGVVLLAKAPEPKVIYKEISVPPKHDDCSKTTCKPIKGLW
jgi:hypothetical protein